MAAVSKRKKIIIAAAALVVLWALVAAALVARRTDQVEVQTSKIERRTMLESKVTANGEVRPVQYTDLTAEVPGRVTDVYVKEGEKVKKGTPLLRVDTTQLATQTSF